MAITTDDVSCVYWIHRPEHTDILSQGYVGITKRFDRRLVEHSKTNENRHLKFAINKYGWENLVKEKILISNEEYCLDIESKLRPKENIGWNLAKGGGKPPVNKNHSWTKGNIPWNKGVSWSDEKKSQISDGVKKLWEDSEYREHMYKVHQGQKSPMDGKKHSEETIKKISESKIGKKHTKEQSAKISAALKGRTFPEVTCPHCGKIGRESGMKSWHFNNCRDKEVLV